jgi:hypothetical protein
MSHPEISRCLESSRRNVAKHTAAKINAVAGITGSS